MNKIFSVIFVSIVLSVTVAAQQTPWQGISPLPQGNVLNGMCATGVDSIVAVGAEGTVLRTSNGGTTWQVQTNVGGFTGQLYAVYFISSMIGWSVGEYGTVLKTTDGGVTWFSQVTSTMYDFNAIHFVSANQGWAAGLRGTIYGTTDGGSTWTEENSGAYSTFFSIQFVSPTIGWVVGESGTILKTTNGGSAWIAETSNVTKNLYGVNFVSPTIGWAVGSFGTIIKTTNGGLAWTSQVSGTDMSLYALHFLSSSTGWVGGGAGFISRTTDGGQTWIPYGGKTSNDLYGIKFTTLMNGWTVGDYGTILTTTDGGSTWIFQSTGIETELYATFFINPSLGWAVGDVGEIISTTDGGSSWMMRQSNMDVPLYAVHFIDNLTGWTVGDSGVILKTTDGGLSWVFQPTHLEICLNGVFFLDASMGWAVGDGGTILKTTNGGTSWYAQSTTSIAALLNPRFFDAQTGFIVGYSGTILKTTDGGISWTEQSSGTDQTLYWTDIVTSQMIVVAGDFGTIVASTDGGTSWSLEEPNTAAGLYGIAFYSTLLGWAVGDDGIIIATTDGGTTWQEQVSGTGNTLLDIQVMKGTTGGVIVASGFGATILTSGILPLPSRHWTGTFDSLWTNPANWSPKGVPTNLDSVYIPVTAVQPALRALRQQINIAALKISAGARLTIGPGLAKLVVESSMDIGGTLQFDPSALTQVFVGNSFSIGWAGSCNPGKSTIILTNPGSVQGSFYNLIIGQDATIQSSGNIVIANVVTLLSDLQMRQIDTLSVRNTYPWAMVGSGVVRAGTVKRSIAPGSTETYQFESPVTTVRFNGSGTNPGDVLITTYPNTLPPLLADSVFVRRYYLINAVGGSGYKASLSLRYDPAETAIPIEDLAIFSDSSGVLFNLGLSDFLDDTYSSLSIDSLQKLSLFYIGKLEYIPRQPFEFYSDIVISDHGKTANTLLFGASPEASDGIDTSLGESLLGSKPPAGIFDVRWRISPSQSTVVDLRALLDNSHQNKVYTCEFQPGPGGYPVTLKWSSESGFPLGRLILRDSATGGSKFSINMKTQDSLVITDPVIKSFQAVHSAPAFYPVRKDWNLVSNPLKPTTSSTKAYLFPMSISNAFGFDNGYYFADTLKRGSAYWMKFWSAQNVGIEGLPSLVDTFSVDSGWNLIGSISGGVAINSIGEIPASIIAGAFYRYAAGYFITDSILPARGYWIRVNRAGKLVLKSAGIQEPVTRPGFSDELRPFNTITINDRGGGHQTLYFGVKHNPSLSPEWYEMPPLPPGEVFDARFQSQGLLAVVSQMEPQGSPLTILLQSARFPLTIEWNMVQNDARAAVLGDGHGGTLFADQTMEGRGKLTINNPNVKQLSLVLGKTTERPKEIALRQNYPNPFNPSTSIQFELPRRAKLSLRIFNILGQEVTTLLNDAPYDGGVHIVQWNAGNLSSGVYLYQLIVHEDRTGGGDVVKVGKMLFLK